MKLMTINVSKVANQWRRWVWRFRGSRSGGLGMEVLQCGPGQSPVGGLGQSPRS